MDTLPGQVVEYLQKFIVATRHPAYLLVDHYGRLQDWGGDLWAYGIEGLQEGALIREQVYFLDGLLPLIEPTRFCPGVQVSPGRFADIHLFPENEEAWVLLLDVTTEEVQRHRLQQKIHDLTLLRGYQARSLQQQLIFDLFQHLDKFIRDVLIDVSRLADVCAALDILVLESLHGGSFRVIGTIPQWFTLLHYEVVLGHDDLQPGVMFPFLENFLVDAEAFWSAGENGALKSGPWREVDRSGDELYLEASALRWGASQFLIIAQSQREDAERPSILQNAREGTLGPLRFGKEVGKRESLFHGLVHDLGGLLMSIMASFILLRTEDLTPTNQTHVEMGMQAVKRQQLLLQELLDLFAAEMGAAQIDRLDLAKSPDVVLCVREVVQALRPLATLKNIRLQLAPALTCERGCKVVGEAFHLQQVLFNLVENALRHGPPASTVMIDIRRDSEEVTLAVEDVGPGVPPECVGTLFQGGVQGEGHTGNAGFGLSFCRMTVERWGGRIGYTPRPEGGSRFWVRLRRAG